jgi:hypothetical protein
VTAILPNNSGYEIVNRKDNKLGAGGVLITLRSDLIATPLKELDTSCEVVWIKLEINKSKPLYIGSFYRTPSKDDPDVINKLHESILKLTCKHTVLPNIILTGDVNVPDIIWDNMSIRNNPNYSLQLNNTMIDFVNANYLSQLTDQPTRNDNILDLTLTTNPDIISGMEILPGMSDHCTVLFDTNPDIISGMEILPGMSDHCTVLFDVNVTAKRQRKPDRYVYQYKKDKENQNDMSTNT